MIPEPNLTRATLKELDQWSIRTGADTVLNICADAELQRRGFRFDPHEACWVRNLTSHDPAAALLTALRALEAEMRQPKPSHNLLFWADKIAALLQEH